LNSILETIGFSELKTVNPTTKPKEVRDLLSLAGEALARQKSLKRFGSVDFALKAFVGESAITGAVAAILCFTSVWLENISPANAEHATFDRLARNLDGTVAHAEGRASVHFRNVIHRRIGVLRLPG